MATGGKKDYGKIAAEKMYRPSMGRRKKPRILVYSRPKKGKTTFCTSAPNVLVLDPEYGGDYMETRDPHLWPIEVWEDIDDVYKYLKANPYCPHCTGDAKHKFEWVAVDGLTRISNMALKFVMRLAEERDLDRQPGQVAQRDYGKAGEMMKTMFSNFGSLPMGIIYTAHERQDAPFQGDEDDDSSEAAAAYVADLPKGVRGAVNGLVDVIGRLYTVKIESAKDPSKMITQRRLWLGTSDQYDTGGRSEYKLPDMLKTPTIPKLINLMAEGSTTTGSK